MCLTGGEGGKHFLKGGLFPEFYEKEPTPRAPLTDPAERKNVPQPGEFVMQGEGSRSKACFVSDRKHMATKKEGERTSDPDCDI